MGIVFFYNFNFFGFVLLGVFVVLIFLLIGISFVLIDWCNCVDFVDFVLFY